MEHLPPVNITILARRVSSLLRLRATAAAHSTQARSSVARQLPGSLACRERQLPPHIKPGPSILVVTSKKKK
ncbi:hypothetical protein Cob_v008606 [Colletotrichum orbiculare MAFF 240422]|uniref:Uncharacterized protein n=1 Tax=Colletotrichum orbiculare (strain 104-T / ATCC 96160 / CBS 514.97 / LARS 414 / MAFF 240422) TaxID=1213857 RepID=A0A484FL30_COLOR|nr:hypothetical protein Cob_v008606 [Colletotrichum orbiculare MAFF 240422]